MSPRSDGSPRVGHESRTKRIFDIAASTLLLIALSPAILSIAGLVLFTLGRPVLFRQRRPGHLGKPFEIIKFRTMRPPLHEGEPDAARLPALGRWLRRTSLDELPELINVLKGEMSLVGPRPLLMDYLPLYSPYHRRRHEVRPGITGLAQVELRNAGSWQEQFDLDVWYVDNQSLRLDLKILWRTVGAVASGRDVNQPGEATRTRFSGYDDNPATSAARGTSTRSSKAGRRPTPSDRDA